MKFEVRLRQDSGSKSPEYTKEQVMDAIANKTAVVQKSTNGTFFILDTTKTNKIMAVVE
jgi:hypothetical protein